MNNNNPLLLNTSLLPKLKILSASATLSFLPYNWCSPSTSPPRLMERVAAMYKPNLRNFNNNTMIMPLPTSTTTDKFPIRRLSPVEIELHREKGLCYNCDEKFFIGHRCKGKSTLLYLEGLDDDIENDQPPEDTPFSFKSRN
ncbi:hypothetical protein Patl1_02427 [Pistacia atlantica]|uniref:Uncharacterized protein n=1 Tax=Pistacia atlantica TaxID=434234 RepID=A0ACC1CA36_9ROSI|nr:hypothetical protein Patl1_02427 [Pistacia atlantica]